MNHGVALALAGCLLLLGCRDPSPVVGCRSTADCLDGETCCDMRCRQGNLCPVSELPSDDGQDGMDAATDEPPSGPVQTPEVEPRPFGSGGELRDSGRSDASGDGG